MQLNKVTCLDIINYPVFLHTLEATTNDLFTIIRLQVLLGSVCLHYGSLAVICFSNVILVIEKVKALKHKFLIKIT